MSAPRKKAAPGKAVTRRKRLSPPRKTAAPKAKRSPAAALAELKWHPIDECLAPLRHLLTRLRSDDARMDEIRACADLPGSCPEFVRGLEWLRPRMVDYLYHELIDRCDILAESVSGIFDFREEVRRGEPQAFIRKCAAKAGAPITDAKVNAAIAADGRRMVEYVRKLAASLEKDVTAISQVCRSRPDMRPNGANPDFMPTALQRRILASLVGTSRTADELERHLPEPRASLYGGKSPSGLNELTRQGWVSNDRKFGGYYRPDAPPKI